MEAVIKVDFKAKQVIEASNYTEEQVLGALELLRNFTAERINDKEKDITTALQVMDHDIEDMTDEQIEESAVPVLKRRRALRESRRDIKGLAALQKKIAAVVSVGTLTSLIKVTEEHISKGGSTDRFFEGTIKRKDRTNKILIRNSRAK